MIDLFFCSIPSDEIRQGFADKCWDWWQSESDIMPFSVAKPDWCPPLGYQSYRRMQSEIDALSPIYILADDDCLPLKAGFVMDAVEILRDHPEYGILSLWPDNANIMPCEQFPHQDDDVMEHVSVGGIRFIKKGIICHWPEQNGRGYDLEHCNAIRRAGFKVGYFKNIRMNHLGEGHSTVW